MSPRTPLPTLIIGLALAFAVSAQTTGTTGRAPVNTTIPNGAPIVTVHCAAAIDDQVDPTQCIWASSRPRLGMLYPYPGLDNLFTAPSFVGGGRDNTAVGQYSSVGGGKGNTASGNRATVGGGTSNTASGSSATVGGGRDNTAA